MPVREPLGGSCEKCNIYKIIPYIPAGIFKGCLKKLILKGIMMMIRRTRHTRTKQGFEAWLKNCEGFLHWLIKKYYFGPMEHEDVFQESCIAAWKGYMSFDAQEGTKLTTYIGTCVKNRIFELHVRETALKRPQTVNIGMPANFEEAAEDYILYEEDYDSKDRTGAIFEVINNLPDTDRRVVLMTLSGKLQTEIGKELGCSQSLVSYYLKRARCAIKERIA